MSRYANFPASDFMTDFEIVEIQNEIRRQIERTRLVDIQRIRQEELIRRQAIAIIDNDPNYNNCQIERIRNDSMIRREIESIVQEEVIENILANKDTIETASNSGNEEEDDEEESEEEEEGDKINAQQSALKSPESNDTTTTSSSNSSASMHLARDVSLSLQVDFSNDKEEQDNQSHFASIKQPRKIHNNDTNFMEIMNILQKRWKITNCSIFCQTHFPNNGE
jgi:hypothetical protein